jgi:hypothetical protein
LLVGLWVLLLLLEEMLGCWEMSCFGHLRGAVSARLLLASLVAEMVFGVLMDLAGAS